MLICKDIYEYMLNFVDDNTAINMLSVNKKFNDDKNFERLMRIKYPKFVYHKKEYETWKKTFIRNSYFFNKLENWDQEILLFFDKFFSPENWYNRVKECKRTAPRISEEILEFL